jgi:hypothetical protein
MNKNMEKHRGHHRWQDPRTARLTKSLSSPFAVWWVVLVAVFFAIAPGLLHSHQFSDTHAGDTFEICSTQKLASATPDLDAIATDSATRQESASLLQHCPFCLHSEARLAPPPSLLTYDLLATAGPQAVTDWRAPFFKKLHALWLESRGPPTLG